MIKTIRAVKISPMALAVLSSVIVEYYEGDDYSFLEEHGTIEGLCSKFDISKENDSYDCRHLSGKKCILTVEEGKTIFLSYYKSQ